MNALEEIQGRPGDRARMLGVLEKARQIVLEKLKRGPTAYGLSILQHTLKSLQDSIEQLKKASDEEVTALARNDLRTLHVAMHFSPTLFPDLDFGRLEGVREALGLVQTGAINRWEAEKMICEHLPGPERFESKEERAMIVTDAEIHRISSISNFIRMLENAGPIARAGYRLRKRWLCNANHEKWRSHKSANGQIRELHEHFRVGRSKLLFPGDPTADDRDIIGCYCGLISDIEKGK